MLSFGVYVGFIVIEWCLVFVAVVLVFGVEGFNIVIEELIDFVFLDYYLFVGCVKDVVVGGVLVCVICVVIIGVIIFGLYVVVFFYF